MWKCTVDGPHNTSYTRAHLRQASD